MVSTPSAEAQALNAPTLATGFGEQKLVIQGIIDILRAHPEIQEILLGSHEVRVTRFPVAPLVTTVLSGGGPQAPSVSPSHHAPMPPVPPVVEETPGFAVPSPMVGTVYVAPQPGAQPFVKLGGNVAEGQVLVVIEAMKLMNPVKSPKAGLITKICVENGRPVEYDEVLFYIQPL